MTTTASDSRPARPKPAPDATVSDGGPGDAYEEDVLRARMLVGLAIQSSEAVEIMAAQLTAEELRDPRLGLIWEACLEVLDHHEQVHPTLVSEVLEQRGQLQRVGGLAHLHTLMAQAPPLVSLDHLVERALRAEQRRRTLGGLLRAHQLATAADWLDDPEGAAAAVEQTFTETVTTAAGAAMFQPMPTLAGGLDAHLADLIAADGLVLPTGLTDLDRLLKLRPGDLVIVAARPGVGKSLLGLRLARNVAFRHGHSALVVSLEMTRLEVNARILAAETGTELVKLLPDDNRKPLTDYETTKLRRRAEELADKPLVVDATAAYSVSTLRSRLRRMQRTGNQPSLVVLDYLGLMQLPNGDRHDLALGEAARQLKVAAGEFGVPIVCLHQMNREVEKRQDKTPVLSDLHNSGALEQHANAVVLMSPETTEDGTRTGVVTLHVAKNRSGPLGEASVLARGHYGDLAPLSLS